MKILYSFLFIFILSTSNVMAQQHPDSKLLTLTSPSFHDHGVLPDRYSCNGKDISPQLSWDGVPEKTKTLALAFTDLDAPVGTFYHWILYNIPPTVTTLPENVNPLPPQVIAGKNSWNNARYRGPCPPIGSKHYYVFSLYALDKELHFDTELEPRQLIEEIQKNAIDQAEIGVTFGR